MIVTFEKLVDEGRFDMPLDVPYPTAINALRMAAIEFCDRSMVYVADLDPVSVVADEATYSLDAPNGTKVVRIEQAWFNGVKLTPTTRLDLARDYANWPTITGSPTHYTQENTEEVILFPKPTSALADGLTMKVALKPSRTATVIENWLLEKYQDDIFYGAKWHLFEMTDKPWANGDAAMYCKAKFDESITAAQLSASKGMGKARLRTTPQYL